MRNSYNNNDDFPNLGREGSSEITYRNNEISIFELGSLLLNKRKLFYYIMVPVFLLSIVILLLTPNKYVSSASILPSGQVDKFSELKSFAGLGSFSSSNENSSELYPIILKSNQIKTSLLEKSYLFKDGDKESQITLDEYFGIELIERDKLFAAIGNLAEITVDKKTGVIKIAIETESPEFSQAILEQYIIELENFNTNKRRTHAKDNVKYLTKQLKIKKDELEISQNNMQQFQLTNRDWVISTDPYIISQLAQFKLDLEMKVAAYTFLNKEYELAKFESQKDTPIVQLLDHPSLPTQKSGPFRLLILILILISTFAVTLISTLTYDILKKKDDLLKDVYYKNLKSDFSASFPRINRIVSKSLKKMV